MTDSGAQLMASFLGGVVIAGVAAFIAYPKDLPTKSDLAASQQQIQKEIDLLTQTELAQQQQQVAIVVDIAKIKEKLGIGDSK